MYGPGDALIVLGRSPMVCDIEAKFDKLSQYRLTSLLNRNTDEDKLYGEDWTGGNAYRNVYYISCIGSPRSYLTKVSVLDSLEIKNWIDYDLRDNTIDFHGYGNLIFDGVYTSVSARIGRHCLLMPNCVLNHDVSLGNGVNIAPGAVLGGGVVCDGNTFIGMNATIKENVRICKDVLIGANSFVNRDITESGVYVGTPIRRIK